MNSKTKIISLVILGLLTVPAMIFPKQTGEVLGINENKEETGSINEEAASDGEIGSGAREVVEPSDEGKDNDVQKITPSDEEDEEVTMIGKVLWDSGQINNVETNKFPLGTAVRVDTGVSNVHLVVDALRSSLAEETILVVNTETYIKLGGNPEDGSPVSATVYVD